MQRSLRQQQWLKNILMSYSTMSNSYCKLHSITLKQVKILLLESETVLMMLQWKFKWENSIRPDLFLTLQMKHLHETHWRFNKTFWKELRIWLVKDYLNRVLYMLDSLVISVISFCKCYQIKLRKYLVKKKVRTKSFRIRTDIS